MNRKAWLAALLVASLLAFGCDSEDGVDNGMDPTVDNGPPDADDMGAQSNLPPVFLQLAEEPECASLSAGIDAMVEGGLLSDAVLAIFANSPGITVFCPSNESVDGALAALGIDLANADQAQLFQLLGIVAYHIHGEFQDAAALTDDAFEGELQSFLGITDGGPPGSNVNLYFNTDADGVEIRYFDFMGMEQVSTVTEADVAVEGDDTAIIHKVDSLIIPPSVAAVAVFEGFDLLAAAAAVAAPLPTDPPVSVLQALFDPTAVYTLFAPTNEAFTAAVTQLGLDLQNLTPEQAEDLRNILLYHVVSRPTRIFSTAIPPTADNLAGLTLVFDGTDINGGSAGEMPTGAGIIAPTDINASNGVVHTIDRVLLPLNTLAMAQAVGDLSSLVTTVLAADAAAGEGDPILTTILADPGTDLTVFAPTNTAFAALDPAPTPDEARDVLLYHVVTGAQVASGDLTNEQVITTALDVPEANRITVGIEGTAVTFTDGAGGEASPELLDVRTSNGIIHIIDSVLLPGL